MLAGRAYSCRSSTAVHIESAKSMEVKVVIIYIGAVCKVKAAAFPAHLKGSSLVIGPPNVGPRYVALAALASGL
jgi:hypothetical protein